VERKTKTAVETGTTTLTRADVRAAIQAGKLTEEEERYVRMRFGINEPPETALQRRGTAFPQTRAYVSEMEAQVLARLAPTTPTDNPVKDRIIARLRRM